VYLTPRIKHALDKAERTTRYCQFQVTISVE
jgi:hypothetical protein